MVLYEKVRLAWLVCSEAIHVLYYIDSAHLSENNFDVFGHINTAILVKVRPKSTDTHFLRWS